jgi:hypothetical protein
LPAAEGYGRKSVEVSMDIPYVHCPACGDLMTIRDIVPDERHKSTMHFVCDCGFAYSMSARAKHEYNSSSAASRLLHDVLKREDTH